MQRLSQYLSEIKDLTVQDWLDIATCIVANLARSVPLSFEQLYKTWEERILREVKDKYSSEVLNYDSSSVEESMVSGAMNNRPLPTSNQRPINPYGLPSHTLGAWRFTLQEG